MCWHIIGPLGRMGKHRIAIGDLPRHESFEITHDIRISIFAKHERGAGVVDEDVAHTGIDAAICNKLLNLATKVVGTATLGFDLQFLASNHRAGTYGAP